MIKKILPILLTLFLSIRISSAEDVNFLLITIDTWRADYISVSGSKKVETPFLDMMAREGIYLKYVDTPCPMTTPSHASILTGLYPKNHGIRDNRNFKLQDNIITLATLFKEKGYKTYAVVSGIPLLKRYGLNKDFDIYDDEDLEKEDTLENAIKGSLKSGEQISERALKILQNEKEKTFLWMHFYDPHYPYKPPAMFDSLKDPYAGEVAYVDWVLKDFFEKLLKDNKKWMVITTGDHGEDLNEHNEETHGILLYNTTRKVPLILWDQSKKVKTFGKGAKSLIDIFPTIVEIFDLRNTNCDGESLFKDTQRALFSETYFPLCFGANPGFSFKKEDFVFIKHGTSNEVYKDDFKEGKNFYSKNKDFVKEALREIKNYSKEDLKPNLKLSEEELKTLSSLGYISSSSSLSSNKITECDLREVAKDFTSYTQKGWEVAEKKNPQIIIDEYDRLIKKYPYAPLLHCDKSGILIRMKRYEEAYKECNLCVMLDPQNSVASSNFANLLAMRGKFREAEKYYLISLTIDEKQPITHYNLGMIYFEKLNNKSGAVKHLKRFLELDPQNPNSQKAKKILKELQKE